MSKKQGVFENCLSCVHSNNSGPRQIYCTYWEKCFTTLYWCNRFEGNESKA